jgi:hypothetical protein
MWLRVLPRGLNECLEPARLGECIRIEQRQPVAVSGSAGAEVVGCGEADVRAHEDQFDLGKLLPDQLDGAVCRAVVDHDRSRGLESLPAHAFETASDLAAAVEVDDHKRDSRVGHRSDLRQWPPSRPQAAQSRP